MLYAKFIFIVCTILILLINGCFDFLSNERNKKKSVPFDERTLPNRWNSPVKLSSTINFGYGWQDQPWISPDNRRLYFVYYDCGNPSHSLPGSMGIFDIYVSEKDSGGSWSSPAALPSYINSIINEAAAVESLDGGSLYFTQQDYQEALNSRLRREIFVSRKNTDGSWGSPKSLGPLINAPGKQQDCPSLTSDGKIIFFMRNDVTADGTDGDTGMHIYYAAREDVSCDDCWGDPVIMPYPVTGDREIQPMIRPDGKTLYFSKIYSGQLYLAVTHKNDDGTWTEPERLDDLHDNGSAGEGAASLTSDGMTIYFARAYPTGLPGGPCEALRFEFYSAARKMKK